MKRLLLATALLPIAGLAIRPTPALAYQAEAVPSPTSKEPQPPPREVDTPADRFGFIAGQQFQVSSGTDDDNATFRIGLPNGPAIANRFSLTFSTPLHGNDLAMPASLDALANGSRVTLSWGHFDLHVGRPDAVARRIRAWARAECRRREPTQPLCADSGYAVQHYDRNNAEADQRHGGPGATDYGIEATVGVNDFQWLTPTTLMPQTARHTDWSVAGHIVHYLPGTQTAFTASVSYQRAYQAADQQLLCPPNPANPAVDCKTDRGAPPNRNEHLLLSAGLRHRFSSPDGTLLNLALAPVVTYDALSDVFGVDVPVYFVPAADGGLTGGVRFGYRSDRDDHFTVSAFVGAAFNILQ